MPDDSSTPQMPPDQVLRIAAEVTSSLDTTKSLNAACRAAVELLGCDHSGLVLFSADHSRGVVRGEYPSTLKSVGLTIPITGVSVEEELVKTRQPVFIPDVRTRTELGPVRDLLVGLDIWSILLVPVVSQGRLIGSFSIDSVGRLKTFSDRELRVCSALANLIAVAIENATTYHAAEIAGRRASEDAHLLDTLEQHSSHLIGQKERAKLLQETIRLATDLLPGTVGQVFERKSGSNDFELAFLAGLANPSSPIELPPPDGLIQALLETPGPHVFPPDMLPAWIASLPFLIPGYVLFAPLKIADAVDAIVFIEDSTGLYLRQERNIELLRRFLARAGAALETSRLLSPHHRASATVALFQVITDYILRSRHPERIYYAFLTAITAEYGLRLNRALVFLFDHSGDRLAGAYGIGELTLEDATRAWAQFHREANDLSTFLRLLDQGAVPVSTLGVRIQQCVLTRSDVGAELLFSAATAETCTEITQEHLPTLPIAFARMFEPTSPILVVPLRSHSRSLGLLVVDNKFTKAPLTDSDQELLLTFARSTALALDNLLAYSEVLVDQERLRALYEAANSLFVSPHTDDVGNNIVQQAFLSTGAAGASVMIIADNAACKARYIAGREEVFDLQTVLRPSGLSLQVLGSGMARAIEDTASNADQLNPCTYRPYNKAAICLPMVAHGRALGVMWLQYDCPKHFNPREVASLQYFANQAATAYWSAAQIADLDRLLAASSAPTTAISVLGAMELVVKQAQVMFAAKAACLWAYDSPSGRFIPHELVAVGVEAAAVDRLRQHGPAPVGLAHSVLSSGYIEVSDGIGVSGLAEDFVFKAIPTGTAAMQAITLRADTETVGVLFLYYASPRTFDADRERLHGFARYLGGILKTVRLQHHLLTSKRVGKTVAHLFAAGEFGATLKSIAKGARETLPCDAVVLYGYNADTNDFIYPPTTAGLFDEAATGRFHTLPPDCWIREFLTVESVEMVVDLSTDVRFRDRPFVSREGVKSVVVVPLRFASDPVGIMFVNYRHHHPLTQYELDDVRLFAHNAAVAIRTGLYVEDHERRLSEQERLVSLSEQLMRATTVESTRTVVVEFAQELLRADVSHLVLRDSTRPRLFIAAARGWPPELVGTLSLSSGDGSHAGFTMSEGHPIVVTDYATESRFSVPPIAAELGLVSGLSVPMHADRQIVGAVLVACRKHRPFTERDVSLLALIANQAAVALQSANTRDELKQGNAYLHALREAGQMIAASTLGGAEEDLLQQILNEAVKCLLARAKDRSFTGRLYVCDEGLGGLRYVAACMPGAKSEPTDWHRTCAQSIKASLAEEVAISGQPSLIEDVSTGDASHSFDPLTKAVVATPLLDAGWVFGVLQFESQIPAAFDDTDRLILQALGELAVSALRNARQYDKLARQRAHLESLYNICACLATGDPEMTQTQVFDYIAREAAVSLTDERRGKLGVASVQLREDGEWFFHSVYPPGMLRMPPEYGTRRSLIRDRAEGRPIGVAGRTIESGKPQLVRDVRVDGDYICANAETLCEMVAPIKRDGQVIGIVDVECNQLAGFDTEDLANLEALADLSVLILERGQLYRELRERYADLQEVDRKKTEYLGVISHEMRTPLESLGNIIEALLNGTYGFLSAKQREKLFQALERTKEEARLITNVLDLVRIQLRRATLERSRASLSQMARTALGVFEYVASKKGVQAKLNLPADDALECDVDRAKVMQVLTNLIGNAIKHTSSGGEVRLSIERREDVAVIRVDDTGEGIDPRDIPRIFERFVQGTHGAEREGGVGIGLSIVKEWVELHGGRIHVESKLSAGSCFWFTLPMPQQLQIAPGDREQLS